MSENAVSALSVEDADKMLEALFAKLEGVEQDADALPILIANADSIRTIAGAYRKTGLFERAAGKYAEFKADIESDTPPEGRLLYSWKLLLNRMGNAPTGLHLVGAIRLILPLVADYLPAEDEQVEPG